MAREHDIDMTRVKGTGAGGRITKQDMEAHIAQAPRARSGSSGCPRRSRRSRRRRATPLRRSRCRGAAPVPAGGAAKTRIEPMSQMRIKIAEHMVMSKRTSAHVTTIHRVDMTKVAKMRERNKETVQIELRFRPDLPAVHHARGGGGAASVPAAQCVARQQQHHLP